MSESSSANSQQKPQRPMVQNMQGKLTCLGWFSMWCRHCIKALVFWIILYYFQSSANKMLAFIYILLVSCNLSVISCNVHLLEFCTDQPICVPRWLSNRWILKKKKFCKILWKWLGYILDKERDYSNSS